MNGSLHQRERLSAELRLAPAGEAAGYHRHAERERRASRASLQDGSLKRVLGNIGHDTPIETEDLYKAVIEKYNIYHIALDDNSTSYFYYKDRIENSWKTLLGDHLYTSTLNDLPKTIAEIVKKSNSDDTVVDTFVDIWDNNTVEDTPIDSDGIGW